MKLTMTNEDSNSTESLLHFPCEFVIKIFGATTDELQSQILSIIRRHIPDLDEDAIKSRLSKDNKYLALTITMPLDSREQLDAIYQDVSSNPLVLMVL